MGILLLNMGLLLAVLLVAYSNGANDNFKGVATLYGSGTTGYRKALAWATLTTLAGSLLSLALAGGLVKTFSGNGLVPTHVAATPSFLIAAALGTGLTVLIATRAGFPISTTHALTGALVGSGFASIGMAVDFTRLGKTFFLPLAFSPIAALALAVIAYGIFRRFRRHAGTGQSPCISLVNDSGITAGTASTAAYPMTSHPRLIVDDQGVCAQRNARVLGFPSQPIPDAGHFLSAGLVGFARGLNDTPKLVALLTASTLLGIRIHLALIAMAMAIGGVLNSRRVAVTLSQKITSMDHGQGFTANLVTAGLVVLASRFGLPVSTTHVSVGALSGIGLVTGQGDYRVIGRILLSWLLTLPTGAFLGYVAALAASRAG